ncbi:MAG: prepilin peptidase [Candidatus Thorarchaeota archaeon]|jgi:Flp pilus assembly protein protease CpaA
MVLDMSVASIMSFFTIISLLVVYSILDIRDRKIMNEIVFAGGAVGCVVLIFTGHFATNMVLHLTALMLVVPLSYILFRIGSIGGADAKVLCVVTLISPGIELGTWSQPVLEAILALGGELVAMLLGGYLYWQIRRKDVNATPPLVPFLLVGYLVIQLFAQF